MRFSKFWPHYLGEHQDPKCRALHYIGTTLVILTIAAALIHKEYRLFYLAPVFGYGFAWAGHFLFEKNRPATFKHPVHSLLADFVMYFRWMTGRMRKEIQPKSRE